MSIIESKYELSTILGLLATIGAIIAVIVYFVPQSTEITYTGYVIDIEFLGSGLDRQTLVRFDNGETLLFYCYETEIPLNKKIIFYYHKNRVGYLLLDRFEVINSPKINTLVKWSIFSDKFEPTNFTLNEMNFSDEWT